MNSSPIDPALVRGLTQRRISRRDVFRLSGLGAVSLGLAACGVKGTGNPAPVASDFWAGKQGTGHIDFANWPLYMAEDQPELKKFTEETGITVTYKEVINEMPEWFATTLPQLQAGQSIGYDLMVITNGLHFKKYLDGNFLAPLDHSRLPNFAANAAPSYKNSSYDPGNKYSVPWASGFTGLAFDPAKTGRPITKLADLLDPAFKGRVGLMADSQELGNFALWAIGVNPSKSTPADWQKAGEWLQALKDAGAIRSFYSQDFIEALESGDIWISQAWSGDIFQSQLGGSSLEFVIPAEGGTIWTDNFTIPVTAANPVDSLKLIDFFYDPENAATLAEYIGYVTPVPAAKDKMLEHAAAAETEEDKAYYEAAAESYLVFPSAADYAKLSYYRDFKDTDEETAYNDIFDPIVTG